MGKIVSCFCYQVCLLYSAWFKVALSVISFLNSPTMSRIKRMPQAVNSQLFPKINYWWPFYTQYRAWRLKCSLPSMIAFLHSWLTCTCRWNCTRVQERREAFLAHHWSESTKLTSTPFLHTCNFSNESTSVQIRSLCRWCVSCMKGLITMHSISVVHSTHDSWSGRFWDVADWERVRLAVVE